jgi:hypothetical protein
MGGVADRDSNQAPHMQSVICRPETFYTLQCIGHLYTDQYLTQTIHRLRSMRRDETSRGCSRRCYFKGNAHIQHQSLNIRISDTFRKEDGGRWIPKRRQRYKAEKRRQWYRKRRLDRPEELAIHVAPVPRKYPRFPGRPARSWSLYRLAYPCSNGDQYQPSSSSLHIFIQPPVTSSIVSVYIPLSAVLLGPKGFWRRCMTPRITGGLDSVHRQVFYKLKHTMFRKLDVSVLRCGEGERRLLSWVPSTELTSITGHVSSPPHLRTDTNPISERSCFLVSRIPDDEESPKSQ